MPEIIQNQPTTPKRRKKNKETHNAVERHRKEKINSGIKRIGDLLPCSQALKQSKNMILGEAYRYISELKQQNDEMLLNGGDKVQAEEIKRLRLQLEDVRKESGHYIELLKANGINFLDDPTIHWKGKQRSAKVAKITPTHLMSKGIIISSNGNTTGSTGKMPIPLNPLSHNDKQPVNAITIQPSCDVQTLGVPNGTQINEIIVSSSTASHIPLATLIPAVSKPCLAVVEQYTAVAPVAPKFPPPVNYITLQGLCPKVAVTAPLQQTQPAHPTPSLASSTSLTMPLQIQPVISVTSLPQTVVSNPTVSSVSTVFQQDTENRSLTHTIPTSSTIHRTSAASSTQTTWTTLQLTGNTVQPVCQALAIESNTTGQNVQQLSVCPVVANPALHPTPLQVQTQSPMQLQPPAPTQIPVKPRPPQLFPAVVPCPQTAVASQASLLSQATVVSQPAVLHQPSVVPQAALLTQPQAAVVAQPAVLPKPFPQTSSHSYPAIQPKPQLHHAASPRPEPQPGMPSQPQVHPTMLPQAQPAIVPSLQHTIVPQPQAATLPVLQTMQVLQMNSDVTPVIGTSPSQNNPNVVILQQAGQCPAPQVIRDDVNSQTPCQHIVIIQTPTVTPTPQNQSTVVPTTTPALHNQIITSSSPCTTAIQTNATKQLVHILPRPSTQAQTPAPMQAPIQAQMQAPIQAQMQAPIPAQMQAPIQAQMQAPIPAQMQAPIPAQMQAPIPAQMQAPMQAQMQAPMQAQMQAPMQAQMQAPIQAPVQAQMQAQTPIQAPQTITVNGQVYVLQSVKSAEKGTSQVSQSATQIIQPTSEEPSTNVALNCLGALTSLSQSISQVTSQSNVLHPIAPPSCTTVQSLPKTVSGVAASAETVLSPTVPVSSASLSCAVTILPKKSNVVSVNQTKTISIKRTRSARSKDPKQRRSLSQVAAKPAHKKASDGNVTKVHSSAMTDSNTTKPAVEDMSHKTNSQNKPVVVSVASVCSSSSVISVSSSSTITERSTRASGNVSTVTSIVNAEEASKSKEKSTEVTPSTCSVTVSVTVSTATTASTAASPPKASLVTHTKSVAVLTSDTNFQPNKSTENILDTSVKSFAGSTSGSSTSNALTKIVSQNTFDNNSCTSCTPAETSTSLAQKRTTLTSGSSTENKLVVSSVESAPRQPQSIHSGTNVGSTTSGPTVSLSQNISQVQINSRREETCQSVESPQVQTPFAFPATPSPCSNPSTLVQSASTPPVLSQESRNLTTFGKPPKQQIMSVPPTSHINSMSIKLPESNQNNEPGSDKHSSETSKEVTPSSSFSQKETVLSQEVSTLESESFESPLVSNRQTDSPMAGGSSSRGFSVASLLPAGHNITSCPNTFGTFSFTSEQEILAMAARAIFEQDSPGRRSGTCSGDNPASTTATGWDLPKPQQTPTIKERVTGQQLKQAKQTDLPIPKTPSQVSVRGPLVEVSGSGTTGLRLPLSMAYSQSQSQPSTLTSLNVNNLIRPSSVQPYTGSPNLGQQVSVPSPGGAAILVSQSSSQVTPSCSGPGQVNEYPPLKSALMRTHAGAGIGERHQKDMPKRSAQEDLVLPINKRSKPCPAASVGRIDVKATEHVQVMSGQMPPSSSTVMTRNHSDGGGPLFSGNTFMSTVLRPSDGHCPSQLAPHEQNPSSVVHLQQGHSQHATAQTGQNVGGNHYLKHQQQQEQQRHLYQLHHHLTQPDTQIHNIQQRTLLQEQHVHKKRVVRSSQTGPPVVLQKQHHLEKNSVQQHQQQHQQQQSQQHQQQAQQHQQQQQQQSQQHQQHQQQQQQQHQTQQKPQQLPQQQQSHQQQQQQQIQQQGSHSRHQHLQQQIQQQQHFGSRQEKNCEGQQAGPRAHQTSHLSQQDRQPGQDHGAMQRLMGSRTLEQQLTSQASNPVSRSSDLACPPSRQERHRLSSYSAEALIGKTSSAGDQRMGLHLQASRGSSQDQSDLQGYVDSSRGKGNIAHNPQSRLNQDHTGNGDLQRISDCLPFKTLVGGHQLSNFEVQVSRSGDMSSKPVAPGQRGPQAQAGFRIGSGPSGDGRARGTYGPHPSAQVVQAGAGLPREQDGCHQSFMQSLLAPHLPEQSGHQRTTQGCPPVSVEYNCVPGVSSGDLQAKASSPNLHPTQTAPPMHIGDNNKGHISQVSGNLHGSAVRSVLPHPPSTPHSSSDAGHAQGSNRSLSAVSQRSHHIGADPQSTKIRPGDRPRSGNLRPVNTFEPEGSLSLPPSGGVLLGRSQTSGENRRRSIVRFMADGAQVGSDNNLVSDQHLTQNFGFSFIADSGMNPPPPINANASFIPPVTQPSASRTPALLPVEPQNTLPSFYPSYSPAAHPSLPSEIPLQYFSNQMFTSPSADKSSTAPLNNRFGSILSPPRPVGFAQASYPLLTDITPMPIANSSGITPHLSNFNLTSLFPEIATAMPPDGSSMPMSPLLSLANTSSSDSNKQSNRPAHNISHILGHDGTSAV